MLTSVECVFHVKVCKHNGDVFLMQIYNTVWAKCKCIRVKKCERRRSRLIILTICLHVNRTACATRIVLYRYAVAIFFLGGPHTVAAVTHGAIATAYDLTSAPPYPLRLHANIDIFLRKGN